MAVQQLTSNNPRDLVSRLKLTIPRGPHLSDTSHTTTSICCQYWEKERERKIVNHVHVQTARESHLMLPVLCLIARLESSPFYFFWSYVWCLCLCCVKFFSHYAPICLSSVLFQHSLSKLLKIFNLIWWEITLWHVSWFYNSTIIIWKPWTN